MRVISWFPQTVKLLACGLLLASAASAKEGGSSGNGDGAIWLKHWWSSGPTATWPENYPRAVTEFAGKHADVAIHVCQGNPYLRFPVLGETSAREFGLEGTTAPEKFCASRSIGESYGALVMLLVDQAKTDEVTRYLLKKASEKRPLRFVIEGAPRLAKAQGGYTLDSAWVEKGVLHWGPQPRDRRAPLATLRHELVHVLQNRAVGGTIRMPSPAHDVRYESDAIFNDTILLMNTSQEAAFVEGFATALEYPSERHHSQRMWSLPNDLYAKEGQLCYANPWLMGEVEGQFGGPFNSEKYIASTAIRLLLKDGTYSGGVNTERAKWVIDALASPEITDGVDGFARAFDRASGTDLGNRWLREHYFRDYVSGQNTQPEFTKVEKDLFFNQRKKFTYCTPTANAERFLSPLLQRESDAATAALRGEQERELAAKVAGLTSQTLTERAKEVSGSARWGLANIVTVPGVAVATVISKQREIAQRIGNCALDSMDRPGKPDSFFDIIHARLKIVTQGEYDLPYEFIVYRFLDEGCAPEVQQSAHVLVAGLVRLEALASAATTPGSAEHLTRYKEIEDLGKKLDEATKLLRADYRLVSVLEDANADGSFNRVMLGKVRVSQKAK